MIKIKLRKNLLYLLAYYISWYIRKINDMIFENIYHFYPSYIFLYLMTLGEMFGGLIIYLYQYNSWRKKKQTKFFCVYIKGTKIKDSIIKRCLLILFASYFDFMEFVTDYLHIPLFAPNASSTFNISLGFLTMVASSLINTYALGFKIVRHHKVSLIIISICLFLTFILELIYKQDNITIKNFLTARTLSCCSLIFVSFMDCIEKYLVHIDYINPFKILMLEGTFELIMTILLSINKAPVNDIKEQYNKIEGNKFLLIILLFNHFILSGIVNIYEVYCNVIYSPMEKASIDFFMNPMLYLYYFFVNNDFNNNYLYLIISIILSIIIDFFSCVYNEYIILFCFNLEYDTKDEISVRAISVDNIPTLNYDDEEDKQDYNSSNADEISLEML